MINSMAKVKRFSRTKISIQATSLKERKKAKESLHGLINRSTRVTFWTTLSMVLVSSTIIQLSMSIEEIGSKTKCTAMESSNTRMADSTKATILTTESKGMESSPGLMADCMMDTGSTARNKESPSSSTSKARCNTASSKKAKRNVG